MAAPPEPGRNGAGQRVLPTSVTRPKPKPRVVKKAAPVPGQTGAGSGPSPARKPKPSTPTQLKLARGQAHQYASQGKAVQKVADQQEQARQLAEDRQHAAAQHDILTAQDKVSPGAPNFPKLVPVRPGAPTPQGATEPSSQAQRTHVHEVRAQRTRLIQKRPNFPTATTSLPVPYKQKASDVYLTDPAALKRAGFRGPGVLDKIAQSPGKFTANTFKDAEELAATTPTSTYMAVTHPKQAVKGTVEQYKKLVTDPKFAFEHPVTAALMVAPVGKVPGLAAGKVLRVAGKQTLKGETRTLPGTALRQETRLSKDALKNAQQARAQRQTPAPTITDKEIRRRVDEHFEYRRKHVKRVEASKSRELKPEVKALPKDQRPEFIAEELKGARGGAGTTNDRTFVREFGSHWQVDPKSGTVLKPKVATEGHLHPTRPDAQKVVERLKATGHGEFAVKPVSESEFGVVPKVASDYLAKHQSVGSSSATYAKLLRASRQKFTNAVLPLSPKWLTGQVVEGTGRALIHGGPVGVGTGLLREAKVFKALEKQRPGAGKEFRARALPGGHYGGQVQEFRRTPLHELFSEAEDGKIGEWLAKAGRAGEKTPGAKRVVNGWNRYTRTVFDQVNGRFIENTQQRAMLGRSLKDSPLMERRLLGLSNKAASEAAKGLRGTETQVEFGRAVERAYGKYSNFSKSQRERNLHWTPFLPWYSNALKFLTQVLPKDHPVLTSLLAASNVATQKDRQKLGLSVIGNGAKPLFMQGGIPSKGGSVVRFGHYTPWALGESPPLESLASLVMPQFSGTLKNMGGIDWKNQPLMMGGAHGRPFTQPEVGARSAATLAEALVPGAGQAARITGLEDKLSGKTDAPTVLSGKDLKAALLKEVNPLMATGSGSSQSSPGIRVAPIRVKPVRVKPIRIKPVKVR